MTLKKITPEELDQKMSNQEELVVLDVRAEEKFNHFHISNDHVETINIEKTNLFNLDENLETVRPLLPREKEIIVTCTTGNSATKCANILAERDYDVIVLEGGLTAWKQYLNMKNK